MKKCRLIGTSVSVLLVLLCASVLLADRPTSTLVNPRIRTDRSVDTSSIDGILRSLVRDGMTDEQKVLAVFNWVRRVLYHGDGPPELSYDFGVMVHSLGNGSCLRQTTPLAMLLGRLGYQCRGWMHDGHHMLEVRYAGKWHCLDPHMCFYVYNRSSPPQIAGVDELRADAALAGDAVKEGRACPGFLQCGDEPETFGPGGRWEDDSFKPLKIDEPFGRITLRRGETYIRTWMPGDENLRFLKAWQFGWGPYHTCGLKADRKDTINWPIYEPHVAAVGSQGRIKAARHWGIGRIVYAPDLRSDHYKDAVVASSNLHHTKQHGLTGLDPKQVAEVVFAMNCPYIITASQVDIQCSPDKAVTAEISTDKG